MDFVSMMHTNLENADFTDASLELLGFEYANLTNANFTMATITGVNICEANLNNTDFSKVIFNNFIIAKDAKFNNPNFEGAENNIDELDLNNTIYEEEGLPF
uniref:Pentapeptide repeat protein n=1 Tax=uncultured organism TaxID=155900 RepID=M1QCE1_9ZZZZ|nr:hypothetical protein FLSS-16_0029 [uncultured organism]